MLDEISGDFLQWLRGFYFVATEGSVRQATIAMGREKSAISRQIQCLEKELGVTLFDRISGKMTITPEGKKLLEEAVTLFEYIHQIKGEFKIEEIKYRGEIRIAAMPAIIHNILSPYIEQFRKLHPEVTFRLEGVIRELTYEKVESTEVDFGISLSEPGHKTLLCHSLYKTGLVMIDPRNNPYFPGTAVPTLKQIAEAPLILFSLRHFHEPQIIERFSRDGLRPSVVVINNNFLTIKKYVAQGMGVAILSRHAISPEDEQNFNIHSLDQYFPEREYGILLKKKKYLSARVKAFLRTIKPDIDFSANRKPSAEAPLLSFTDFINR